MNIDTVTKTFQPVAGSEHTRGYEALSLSAAEAVVVASEAPLVMYDERHCGTIPSPAAAKKLIADLRAGRVYLHPKSEPGCVKRLEDIVAGRPVDPSFFKLPWA